MGVEKATSNMHPCLNFVNPSPCALYEEMSIEPLFSFSCGYCKYIRVCDVCVPLLCVAIVHKYLLVDTCVQGKLKTRFTGIMRCCHS